MPLFSVRAELLPMKGHFFLFNAGTAPVVPFLPVYAKQLGFSSTLVGVIYTVLPMMGMLAKPITGAIADKLRCHKTLFISFLIVSIISFFSMMYIPPIDSGGIKADLHCNVESDVKICSKKDDRSVDEKLIDEFKDNTSLNCKMQCTVDEQFIISVCTKWNMTQYCSQIFESSNVLGDSLGGGKSRLGYADKISFEKSTTLSPVIFQNLPKNLLLEVQLAPYHSYQVRNCVYIPLGKVKDINSTDNTWHTPYCNKLTEASCQAICESSTLTDFGESFSEYVPIKHYQFWLFVTLMITSWVGMAVVVSIGDTICFGLLGDSPDLYGYQRLWGSVGWGLFSIIAGILVDKFSDEDMKKDYTPVFYLMAVLLILDIVVSLRIKDTERMKSHNILQDIGKLLMDARIMIFMIWCIVVGMCTAVIWNFLFWHLEDLAQSSGHKWIKTLEGLIMCVQCFGGELPFFFLSGWILKRLGHINTMSLVLFAFGIRFILYSLLIEPWWCLPIELLNGLTFGLFYATMTSYASIVAPAGAEATIQGLVGAVFEGVGVSIGSFLAGVLFDCMKGATVFCVYGLVMLVISVLHICVQFYLTRRADIDISSNSKGINSARYASPNDAISMLAEQCELTNS